MKHESIILNKELTDVLKDPFPTAELILDEQAADWMHATALWEEI